MIDQILFGSSACGLFVYMMTKIRCLLTSCDSPVIVIDSNSNELTTINHKDTDVLIISKNKNEYVCFYYLKYGIMIPIIKPIKVKEFKTKQSKYDIVGQLPIRSILLAPSGGGKTILLQNMILDISRLF